MRGAAPRLLVVLGASVRAMARSGAAGRLAGGRPWWRIDRNVYCSHFRAASGVAVLHLCPPT
jgi:hypothetical protein